ncbi:MAG: disulfide bond formation protein B [Pseudomonadota bacterium]
MNKIKKLLLKTRNLLLLIAMVAALLLLAALLMQYGFGLKPCSFCLHERWPYLGMMLVAYYGYLPKKPKPPFIKSVFGVLVLLLCIEIGLTGYHILQEQGLVMTHCHQDRFKNIDNIVDLKAELSTMAPSCDRPELIVLGVSLAGWNLIIAIFLQILLIWHYFYVIVPYLKKKKQYDQF